ncbi:MAG: hypothetical protein K9M49_06630 [Candidatus Marinimicrobia bacterium]|nr:hypothetical protein [Candidatus Neomarinimicrobiota bacterium]MCF7904813.1 hypothetical protein [Candidatus Neomarinimicrobiota bacterium]
MKINSLIPIIGGGGLALIFTVLWFTGSLETLFNPVPQGPQMASSLSIDLETLQITIRTVSSPEIEEKKFIEAIDTLSANESISKLRNPFARVYVAPPPTAKKKVLTRKKATAPKRKKRIVRPKIVASGIIWDSAYPYAILNDDIYGEGDIIKGYTIQTIQDTMVVLVNKDDVFTVVIESD